ncbi:MAG: hypothetical protein CL946_08785 [Ectothiorhodospiraceae bacterium]|nr:hypothetical protein [Ectothiorhodospiraceae bacterium]
MEGEEKQELFSEFESMLDKISDLEMEVEEEDTEEVFKFDKASFEKELTGKSSLGDVVDACFDQIFKLSGIDAGAFYLFDEESNRLHLFKAFKVDEAEQDEIREYSSGSIIVRRLRAGKPTFKNTLGISVLDEVNQNSDAPTIIAVMPVHHNYKIIAGIHLFGSDESEIPDYARHGIQVIAGICGKVAGRFINAEALAAIKAKAAGAAPKPKPEAPAPAKAPAPPAVQQAPQAKPAPKPKPAASGQAEEEAASKVHITHKPPNATQLLINSIPAFTFVMSTDGRIAYINQYTINRMGFPKKDIIGKYITSFYPTGKQYADLDKKYALLETTEGEVEYALQSKDGDILDLEFSVHRTRFNKNDAVICIGHDKGDTTAEAHMRAIKMQDDTKPDMPIGDRVAALSRELMTIRRDMEELKQYSESEEQKKGSFIEKISYEIRSMLNAVIGMTGLLMDTDLSPAQTDYVETIRKSGDTMLSHINDIIESLGGSEPPRALRALKEAGSKQDPQPQSYASLRSKHLLIVDENSDLRNELTSQFTELGMKVKAVATSKEATEIIQSYERVDAVIIDVQMRRGDAIELARQIRKYYSPSTLLLLLMTEGAYDQAQANELGAAEFIRKPYDHEEVVYHLVGFFEKRASKRLSKIPVKSEREDTIKILLVEDNHMDQKVAMWLLEGMGYSADLVPNGKEALKALDKARYDIVLMDIEMPEMDGVETTKKVRDTLPVDRQPRIIAMTAHALKGAREQYLSAGMDDYISKPINEGKLVEAMRRCISMIDLDDRYFG